MDVLTGRTDTSSYVWLWYHTSEWYVLGKVHSDSATSPPSPPLAPEVDSLGAPSPSPPSLSPFSPLPPTSLARCWCDPCTILELACLQADATTTSALHVFLSPAWVKDWVKGEEGERKERGRERRVWVKDWIRKRDTWAHTWISILTIAWEISHVFILKAPPQICRTS